MTSKEIAKIAVNALEDKKVEDLRIIDISGISIMADYFIIGSGSSQTQVHALANNVEEKLHEVSVKPRQIEGYQSASWILMDFNDIVVHIFNKEDRLFYNLEKIWLDGKIIEPSELDN